MPKNNDPNLLVGFDTSDDAGVYRLDDEKAIVVTADFITPPVDDPFLFGQIGAANSLSDIYAMGGKPLTCLNLIGFPTDQLGPEILHGIVEGALSKITEAGAVLAGGHTTADDEPKFGLSVTGIVHPDNYWRNIGARPGDALVLTKPIGSGVLFNANLKKWVSEQALNECIGHITTLNKVAAETMADFSIHAATDITGFALAGHALEMARGSGVTLEIQAAQVPTMREALAMYEKGVSTGVNAENRALIEKETRFASTLSTWQQEIFVDPQTSGGLLVSLPAAQAGTLVDALHDKGVEAACIIGAVAELKGETYLTFS
ncbi:MAG: selenide,water dikinase [Candidatus Latescibacterota bacterium]